MVVWFGQIPAMPTLLNQPGERGLSSAVTTALVFCWRPATGWLVLDLIFPNDGSPKALAAGVAELAGADARADRLR